MNEDFGVGRPRRASAWDVTPRQAKINIDKYQPANTLARIGRMDVRPVPQAVLATTDGREQTYDWDNSDQINTDLDTDSDLRNYNLDSLDNDDNGGGNGGNNDDGGICDNPDPDNKPGRFSRFVTFLKTRSRKQWLITGGVVLIAAAGTTSFLLLRDAPAVASNHVVAKKKAPEPAKPVSALTGAVVSEEDSKRPVIGTMIENSTFARPQSGLKDAGVVYEAIAEYGITRFLALYQEANPGNIGPVRSARPYYVDWARATDAGYAHVGGSPDALSKIKAENIRDLDQFANSSTYHRISQREAPHNVYTSMQKLRELMASKGYNSSNFKGFARKADAPAKTPTATDVSIAISGPTYNVSYNYDAASNSYLRTMGGAPHTDADSGARIAPKVVIGLVAPYGLMADGYHSTYTTTGSGTAKIFQDGTVTTATWKREGTDNYAFFDDKNQPVKLDAGQTWITVVGDQNAITSSAPAAPATTP